MAINNKCFEPWCAWSLVGGRTHTLLSEWMLWSLAGKTKAITPASPGNGSLPMPMWVASFLLQAFRVGCGWQPLSFKHHRPAEAKTYTPDYDRAGGSNSSTGLRQDDPLGSSCPKLEDSGQVIALLKAVTTLGRRGVLGLLHEAWEQEGQGLAQPW